MSVSVQPASSALCKMSNQLPDRSGSLYGILFYCIAGLNLEKKKITQVFAESLEVMFLFE
jgi:hypothetical protein